MGARGAAALASLGAYTVALTELVDRAGAGAYWLGAPPSSLHPASALGAGSAQLSQPSSPLAPNGPPQHPAMNEPLNTIAKPKTIRQRALSLSIPGVEHELCRREISRSIHCSNRDP